MKGNNRQKYTHPRLRPSVPFVVAGLEAYQLSGKAYCLHLQRFNERSFNIGALYYGFVINDFFH
jgi:hypothetical protein